MNKRNWKRKPVDSGSITHKVFDECGVCYWWAQEIIEFDVYDRKLKWDRARGWREKWNEINWQMKIGDIHLREGEREREK